MQLADLAWRDVNTTTIRNCWRKAGILPNIDRSSSYQPPVPISALLDDSSTQMDPVAHAERQVEIALDDLVAMGALQKSNPFLTRLANPTS